MQDTNAAPRPAQPARGSATQIPQNTQNSLPNTIAENCFDWLLTNEIRNCYPGDECQGTAQCLKSDRPAQSQRHNRRPGIADAHRFSQFSLARQSLFPVCQSLDFDQFRVVRLRY